ncbi:BREX-1 system adenine-specific DNA-methyltransferase PglX [Desulfolutivibrio sulfoxidireducens]|uniref:BREX-1 system adenine-specific DNA-methyltransferase PglX n=1 Tax=Desulfolutivibrio sulfoxidireducens TaxID=2773299 RepID=UPI00159E90FB|nr:BREX-1 system adenine-specific DNA-methyltransferase PglX [Desulfolutivibrio sulfoxidireducens]QLA17321.1 BREX-1 system adenine-specific DNA-methyltransferase PglX [Desulfolutivibrio sulfoxidireducens]
MSFDKETRNLLAKTVASCRRRLIEDVTDQLRGVFGLHPDGTVLPLDKLTHLSPDQNSAARRLRDLLDHYTVGAAGKDSDRRKAAYERMVLEISFTVLNRSAALRLCEERGLVVECVRKGTTSAGFQMFERISGGALGGRYDTYRVFLECMFDELAGDLGVLFDRMTPQSAVFPSERCMEDVIAELNKPELTHLWTEDETIGWVYQYFNPPEERKAMREASQAPRNSRELAVRNQFFTPRYVVEFLTDNTLGRIWFEMRKGDTVLKEECRYLVRRPSEVFLGPGEKAPAEKGDETDLSQEELLKRPVYIEHRPKKDPRDLRILDPACGSGHFLLYAFDLLEHIYEEAWPDVDSPKSEVTGRTLQEDFKTLDDLRREFPKLIVEHNLHGIDIDPRAVQIAALALWLRAQKTWKKLGLKANGRPRIARSNIVTAEPMPGEDDMRREFTTGLKPRVLGQIVDEVFEKMKLAGEAGSLLQIEEEIKDAVAAAGKQWREGPKPEQQLLFPAMDAPRLKQQQLRFDVKGITDVRFWEQAEDRILDALKEYAERAENGHATRRRLFAEDAARGFAFIDLCRKRYEVVLMNPPFGDGNERTVELVNRSFQDWNGNLLCAFVARAGFLVPDGYTGIVYDRTANIKNTYEAFRTRYFLSPKSSLLAVADLGWEVLDANVEVTSGVIGNNMTITPTLTWGCDLTKVDKTEKEIVLLDAILSAENPLRKTVFTQSLSSLPNSVIGYYFDDFLIRFFQILPSFEESQIKVFNGHTMKSDEYFRYWWEPDCSGLKGKYPAWARMYNGGAYSRYYSSETDVVYYGKKGDLIDKHPSTIFRNLGLQQKPGIAFGKRGEFIDAHILREGFVSTVEGQACTVASTEHAFIGLAILNSLIFQYGINAYCGQHKYPGYVNLFPIPEITNIHIRSAAAKCKELVDRKRKCSLFDETAPIFVTIIGELGDISGFISHISEQYALVTKLHEEINTELFSAYSLNTKEQTIIKTYGESEPKDRILDDEPGLPTKIVVLQRVFSYYIGCIFGRWDVRIALDPLFASKLPDPFDPLPVCPPGMLVGPDGLPADPNRIVSEEWLRARPDANTLPPEGSVKNPTTSDDGYPLRISWDGVLVDDPGFNGDRPHRDDIVRRVREVFDLLWKDRAHEIEQEACDILGVSDLRDYFRKPTGFFQDHLKRYSKSRRKAPIYWPLSTPSGSYTLWLYYHRLTDQTLYTAVNKYVEPKISEVERGIGGIENDLKSASGRDGTRLTDRLSEARTFLGELRDLREELLRIAALPYKPDLNDGVIINASPFHNLFRLRPWAKDTADCWKKLEKGDYDWAHLAYTIRPDRVREVCRTDHSIAIAHGLENLCEVEAPGAKKKGGPGRRKREAAR